MCFHGVSRGEPHEAWARRQNGKVRILLSRGYFEAVSTEFSKRCGIINLSMAEGEGGYKPPEADVKPPPEKKRSFRDLFKYVVKNWPTHEKYYTKIEEMSEHVH